MRVAGLLALALFMCLASLCLAQVSVSVPQCGSVTVYPSDSYGNVKSTFVYNDFVYITLRSYFTCTVKLTVTLRDPAGGHSTVIRGEDLTLPAGANVVKQLFQVAPATPTGRWLIYVRLNDVDVPPVSVDIAPPLSPAPSPASAAPEWLWGVVAAAVAVSAVTAIVLIRGRERAREERTRVLPAPVQPAPAERPAAEREKTRVGVILYRLVLPNGMEIPVSEPYRVFGRETFERYGLPRDVLEYITREDRGGHFKIYLRGMKWYVEDSGSTNGTLLNGVEIRGKGPQELKDGDVISPAGVINLTFRLERAEVK
jgi:hypothetical protein